MVGKRGRAWPSTAVEEEAVVILDPESQPARLQLRRRWELASVLNFLHVFQPLIQSEWKISAEEIESALISPNTALARVHIALLKGVPPVNKNLAETDVWLTIVCKKLNPWWPWVAEGENPLKVDHGEEVMQYKELDPIARLLILKALCEVRAEQDDILRYITDSLKSGMRITTFRKEKIGCGEPGTTYWYDGDSIIGHRLYKETMKVEVNQKLKGKLHFTQPAADIRWETVATNLDEFREISENLSSSAITGEVSVAQIIKREILPVLEEQQKKKERALKRKRREALLLDGLLNSNGVGHRCSRRERRPVNYTFDDYDRAIKEAIEISKRHKPKPNDLHEDERKQVDEHLQSEKENSDLDEAHTAVLENEKNHGSTGEDDNYEDDDYDANEDDEYNENDDDDLKDSENGDVNQDDFCKRKERIRGQTNAQHDGNEKDRKTEVILKLRRSGRRAGGTTDSNVHANGEVSGHAGMKKRLRERPIRNANYNIPDIPDSDDDADSDDDKMTQIVSDTEDELSDDNNSDDG